MGYLLIFILLFILLFFISKTLTRSVSGLLMRFFKNESFSIRFFHFIFLPGVVIHEFSHLISAEVMFVHTSGLNLSPVRIGDQVTMGSVQIEKTDPIRRAIIGFAPVFVGFLLISISTFFLLSDNSPFVLFVNYLLIIILVFEIGNTMFSSRRDLEGTIELLIALAFIIAAMYILGFHFQGIINFINSKESQEVLLKGVKILLIPIVVDVSIIFLSNVFTKRT